MTEIEALIKDVLLNDPAREDALIEIVTNREFILKRLCYYAELVAKREGINPVLMVTEITGLDRSLAQRVYDRFR